ncbi:restriction endonuclease subunit S [Streptomyces sp. NBC_01321]|uniref:restriction endonuclease subunit S n=1 Tax=Streptomyces sp. NBC_01321 TaxID=2903825 RepID=UPI002E0E9619|nr:restriction endonuclease subunit S [Streptomyces sp. NBC_01321]
MVGLPEGWAWARLGDLGEWFGGGTPSKQEPDYWEGGDVPWLSPKDMKSERLADVQDRITDRAVRESSVRMVPSNSVAIVNRSGVLEHSVPVASVPFATTLNQDMKAVVAYPDVLPAWIAWALRRYERKILDECRKGGTTVASLSTPALMDMRIPVPPFAEQRRIVEALEKQLSRLDAGSALLEEARLRGAVLHKQMTRAVISGRRRTTEEVGDADELLSQVDVQVAHMAGKKRWAQVRDPDAIWTHELPSGWRWRTLGSLCVDIQYGTSAKTAPKENGDDVPVIRMGNIQGGRLDLRDLKYLPAEHFDIEKTLLRDGDLLFNRTNSAELVGKSAVYNEKMGAAVYASYLIRCRFAEGVEPDWVNAVVNSNLGRRYVASVVTQQVGQANVNSAKMALMPIPVPPQSEQRTALKVLRDWEAALARPQLAARVAMKRSKGLRSAILRTAFSGRLAPQDLGDEPAETLLARMAAEREAAKLARRTKRAATRPRKKAAAPPSEPAPAPSSAPSTAVQQEFDL